MTLKKKKQDGALYTAMIKGRKTKLLSKVAKESFIKLLSGSK